MRNKVYRKIFYLYGTLYRLNKGTEVLLSSLFAKQISNKTSLLKVWTDDDPKCMLIIRIKNKCIILPAKHEANHYSVVRINKQIVHVLLMVAGMKDEAGFLNMCFKKLDTLFRMFQLIAC